MIAETNSSLVKLERREMIEIAEEAGNAIFCLSGSLWITRQGRREDTILEPGQSIVLDGKGCAVVQALGYSTLRVTRRAAAGHFADSLQAIGSAAFRI